MTTLQTAHAIDVLTVGDSITSGLKRNNGGSVLFCPPNGVTTSGFYVCNGNGAVNRGGYQPATRNQLSSIGVSANLYNWGWAGEESWQIVGRVNQAMNTRSAKYVFIMAGVNDLNDNVSAQTTIFNVQQMAQNIIANGRIPIIGTVTPYPVSNYTQKIVAINAGIIAYANANRIAVADHYGAMASNFGAYHSGDLLHISNAGDNVMALKWRQAFQRSIEIEAEIAAEIAEMERQARAKASMPGILTPLLLE